jgi:hypothetical protein
MPASQRENLPLYIALLCFLGIAAILVFDGYLGIYETIEVTTAEGQQISLPPVSPGLRQSISELEPGYTVWSRHGDRVRFQYRLHNRRFATYSAPLEVTLWKGEEQIKQLLSREGVAKPFGQIDLRWTLDTGELEAPQDNTFPQYTVRISREGVKHRITVILRKS